MKLSIVTTVFYSSKTITPFYQQICQEVEKITTGFEIIIVDDGSMDDSLAQLLALQKEDNRLKVIELSRNFGHHQAGIIGLKQSIGDYVFLIDSDLEERPEHIHKFWNVLNSDQELFSVYGIQKEREGGFFQQISGNLFYKLFNFLSEVELPKNIMTVRLMKRDYVDALLQYPERVLFLGGLMAHAGFKQQAIEIEKNYKGNSHYSLNKKLMLLVNSIVSFSIKPIYFLFITGAIFFIISSLGLISLGLANSFTLTFSLLFILALWVCSVFLTGLGILGLYIAVIFQEVKQRPLAIIKKIHQKT